MSWVPGFGLGLSGHWRQWLSLSALFAAVLLRPAGADLVLLDEYWSPEIVVNDVTVTEVDTQATGDPTEAKFGDVSAKLENTTGSPNVRFRSAGMVTLSQIPAEVSEARLWYRTDRWAAIWRLEIWVWYAELTEAPVRVLQARLDGGGEGGRLIPDDQWHQARGLLAQAEGFEGAPPDRLLTTYVWLAPEEGWNQPHRTYVDRAEVVVEGDLAGHPAPEPARRVRPRPGAQANGPGWVWWEGEDAVETTIQPGGACAPDTVEQQVKLSNGAWLQYHGGPGLWATWEVEVPAVDTYSFWCRGMGSRFDWRWDDGEWQTCDEESGWTDEVRIRDQDIYELSVSWVRLADLDLAAGKHVLQVDRLPEDDAVGFDCWLLTREPFTPNGPDQPAAR